MPTTSGEEVAAKMAVRHLEKCGVAPTLREMTALPLGTVTGELLTKLVKQLEETRGDSVALDERLAIDTWVAEAGPATMPLPLLCNLMMELPAMMPLQSLPANLHSTYISCSSLFRRELKNDVKFTQFIILLK